ncbi:MAG: acyl carrier protein [Corynebacterium sp.]|nr:acyl carrier protein [Corynebacterium sp.]
MSADFRSQLQAQLGTHLSESSSKTSSAPPDYIELIAAITGEDPDAFAPERSLSDVNLTSLNMIEFAIKAEDRFGVIITEADAASFATLADVRDFLSAHTAETSAPDASATSDSKRN